ncbi:hypothetical protein Atai01_58600 [Amycolatopsis taiwanensis]|uniref:Uncharacterized protein n=1 Tax=Amycolatopsis taiwanensis TaxID=342230 RepID=A0A9W6R5B3_9PSEU|nr:hypothetical protein Atai01_58600 [Amycolatopsis taiwanensis]
MPEPGTRDPVLPPCDGGRKSLYAHMVEISRTVHGNLLVSLALYDVGPYRRSTTSPTPCRRSRSGTPG